MTAKRGIHSIFSTNCIAAELRSKLRYSGMVTRRPSSAPTSATARTTGAFRSWPKASRKTPKMIGIQIAALRSGKLELMGSR